MRRLTNMKNVLCIILAFVLTLSLASSAFSAGGCMGQDAGIVTGKVNSVDLIKHTVTMKVNINNTESEKTFVFDNDTNVVEGNTLKTVNDIKSGDKIAIIYKTLGNDTYARTITLEK